jgi:putative methionine-R-sulfoxide reductase with GAF domain
MAGFAHPEDPRKKDLAANLPKEPAEPDQRSYSAAAGPEAHQNTVLSESELDSALQLLVERAQYITGATGAALALPQGEEMVCRASAGSSAPAPGARLQVRSGLTGESIARRQLLRCDNAESDSRVNLEACRALGIASIVVLPLMRRNGEVRGLFELFSDHPYAFEERDLIALERMADLTLTALDLAEQGENIAPGSGKSAEKTSPALGTSGKQNPPAVAHPERPVNIPLPLSPGAAESERRPEAPAISPSFSAAASAPAPLPEPIHLAQKCSSCGFPVSEGRTLCLDCEKKNSDSDRDKDRSEAKPAETVPESTPLGEIGSIQPEKEAATNSAATPEEFVPAFLVNSAPARESWLTNPVNLLAFVVLVLCILVALVVFR